MSKNASQYWMPVTLRKLPGSLPLMISMLKENQDDSLPVDDVNYLFAHLSVLSAARLNDLKFEPVFIKNIADVIINICGHFIISGFNL